MSFAKAEQLLELATLVASRRTGYSLEDTEGHFGVSRRTAQRMMRALEFQFPDIETFDGDDGRKRWRLGNGKLRDLITVTAEELAALELSVAELQRAGLLPEARAMQSLRDKVISLIPRSITRLEPDCDALLEAQGFVARPGPKPRVDEKVHDALVEGIKACRLLSVRYKGNHDVDAKSRKLAPLGFLSGKRRYLVAQDLADKAAPKIKTFRVDGIRSVRLLDQYFTRPDDFDLQEFANSAFGVFQRDAEIGEVVWQFAPEAAEQALSYQFHPHQTEERQPDGSLIVRFRSAGYLEMAWYLYAWGDKVTVLAPKDLKKMVKGYQRSDFPALP